MAQSLDRLNPMPELTAAMPDLAFLESQGLLRSQSYLFFE